jgi:hypothetical protein
VRGLLERAKQLDRLQLLYPEMTARGGAARSRTRRSATVTSAAIGRGSRAVRCTEDAVAFRVRLENPGETPVVYDRRALAMRVGREIFPRRAGGRLGRDSAQDRHT